MDDAKSNRPEEWVKPEVEQVAFAAATVVLVRDATDGIEVLLARRNSKIYFAGGAWVFPGGRIDAEDHGAEFSGDHFDEAHDDFLGVARRACVREAAEEADASINADELVFMSHWTPPLEAPKRFSTYFFMGPAPTETLTADGDEIHELAWMRPADAMSRRNAGEIELIPPTFITLALLAPFATAAEALDHYRNNPPEYFVTKFTRADGYNIALYSDDAGYETADASVPGPRNRLFMGEGDWRYERDV
ncbi:MutT NTP pyrophosphohydrolases including oxidative damage repair enzymes [Acidimicrobiia bacterium]